MLTVDHLLRLADVYRRATALEEVTLSHRLFADSKKLNAMRDGADITVKRFNNALLWFAANWPADVAWPDDIPRPIPEAAA